jgi:hypothetical protein
MIYIKKMMISAIRFVYVMNESKLQKEIMIMHNRFQNIISQDIA